MGSGHDFLFPIWINKIIKKHWQVLKSDNILGPKLPEKPNVIFRRNTALKDTFAPSSINPPETKIGMFGNLKGFFPCKRCKLCKTSKTVSTSSFSSNVTSKRYEIDEFITCGTIGVICLLICPCGLQYVGRTTQALKVRINEHLTNICKGFIGHSVSRHIRECYGRDHSQLKIIAIEKYSALWRGSNMKRQISRRETQRIFDLCSYHLMGLNIEWDFNCYINNS